MTKGDQSGDMNPSGSAYKNSSHQDKEALSLFIALVV